MTYEEKLQKAREIVEQYNGNFPEDDMENRVNVDEFVEDLKVLGGTNDDALRVCDWKDLLSLGLPTLVAKNVASMFRRSETALVSRPKFISPQRAEMMTAEELFAHYDPREENTVSKRLREISGNKRCVVFADDNTVNTGVSAKILGQLRDGYGEVESLNVDGMPTRVYKVGERPSMMADVNPLFPDEVLRPNGVCDRTGVCWTDVPHDCRVLIYLAVKETKEINTRNVDALNVAHIMQIASSPKGTQDLGRWYRNASLRLQQLRIEDNIPSLKRPINASPRPVDKPNSPFGGGNKTF